MFKYASSRFTTADDDSVTSSTDGFEVRRGQVRCYTAPKCNKPRRIPSPPILGKILAGALAWLLITPPKQRAEFLLRYGASRDFIVFLGENDEGDRDVIDKTNSELEPCPSHSASHGELASHPCEKDHSSATSHKTPLPCALDVYA